MARRILLSVLALACVLVLPATARAQSAIAGVVKDTPGAVLPGVTVEASSDVLIEKTLIPTGRSETCEGVLSWGCMLAALTLGLEQPVAAQNNAGELSVGYSFLANDDLAVNQKNLPWGFFFDSALEVNDWVSLAGDLNGHFKRGIEPSASLDRVVPPLPTADFQAFSFNRPETGFCSPRIQDCRVDIQTISAVGGPRFHVKTGRARPFVHVMAGATRSLRKIEFFAHTSTNFTIQPGGGVDVDMTGTMALRIQGDYRRVFFGVPDQTKGGASLVSKDGADHEDVIFSVGVVLKLGER